MLGLAVHVGLGEHRLRAVGGADTSELRSHQLGGLVPRDPYVLALAPVLGIAATGAGGAGSTVGIPVNALQGVTHAVSGVNAPFVGKAYGAQGWTQRRFERLALSLQFPRVEVLGVVAHVVVKGADAGDAAFFDIDEGGRTGIPVADQAGAPDDLSSGSESGSTTAGGVVAHGRSFLATVSAFQILQSSALSGQPPVIGSNVSGSSAMVSTLQFDSQRPRSQGSRAGSSGNHQ